MYVVDQLNDLRICFFFSFFNFFPNFSFLIIDTKPLFVGRSVGCELGTRSIFKQINKKKDFIIIATNKVNKPWKRAQQKNETETFIFYFLP